MKYKFSQKEASDTTEDDKRSCSTISRKIESNSEENNLLLFIRNLFLVLCSALLIFAAARNTITWHCQRFWGVSGDFWQGQWERILDTIGEEPFTLWIYVQFLYSGAVYWIFGSFYTLLDVVNKPAALRRYKIQPGTNEPVETTKLLQVIGCVIMNQMVNFPMSFVFYYLIQCRGYPAFRELPTFHWVLFELMVFILIEEIGFYYSHRILHSKFVYKYIHKQHHEWTAPISITAMYCHPIEHIFSNITPIGLGPILMGSHVATVYLWYTIAIASTLHSHSGYHFPFLLSPEFHDYHHLKFTENFGVIGLLDRIHGTDAKFRKTVQYARDVLLVNLKSARELYPEEESKYQVGKKL